MRRERLFRSVKEVVFRRVAKVGPGIREGIVYIYRLSPKSGAFLQFDFWELMVRLLGV